MKIAKTTNIIVFGCVLLLAASPAASAQKRQTISSKTLVFHVPEAQLPEIKKEVKQQVEYKEQRIQDQLEEYLELLLKEKRISKNLQAAVNVTIVNEKTATGEVEQNLHAKYNYEILNNPTNSLKSQIDDYPAGKYKLGSSKAAMSTMQILKQTVENNLSEFLTKGTKVTIKIIGTTDGSQVKSKIPYTSDYGNIEDFAYFLNNNLGSITVNKNTGVTSNEQLGLLRTFGVRQFMDNYIEPLKGTSNSYEHFVQTSNEVGGKNRRVTIELIIHNALKNYQASTQQAVTTTNEAVTNAAIAKKAELPEVTNSDVDINIPANSIENDNTYALIIGNEDYSSEQADLNSEVNVDFARHDAETFRNYCLKTLGVKEEHIIFMKDATAAKMNRGIKKLETISEILKDQMSIVVYYSGHGLPDEKTKDAYLVPVDVSGSDIASGIKVDDLYARLTKNSPKKVTVFLDACFSGGGRNKGLLSLKGVKVKAKEETLNGNLVVFSSSTGEESSAVYKEKQHGIFTYYLLKKLQETKGEVSYKDLYDFVSSQVKLQSVVVNNKNQTPTVTGSSSVIGKWENWKLTK